MTVHEAIAEAESLLPGVRAPEGERDPRWQAVIAVGEFVESDPDAVWLFALRWGSYEDEDLRMAIATCVLEHLLEHHFDKFIARVEEAALANPHFARTASSCWKYGQSNNSVDRSKRFDRLKRLGRAQS